MSTKKKKGPCKKKDADLFSCTVCNKQFGTKYGLETHVRTHAATHDYSCVQCNYTCVSRKYLARHTKQKHGEKTRYKCVECGKMFHYRSKMAVHMRVHTGEKPHKCEECGKSFSAMYSLSTHRLIHTNEKPFACTICPYTCRDSSTLRKHVRRHAPVRRVYQCKECHVTYKLKYLLKAHVAEKHLSLDLRKYTCEHCGMRFREKNRMSNHIRNVHERVNECECEICGTVLSNKANLTQHLRTHAATRPYACAHTGCDKNFKDPMNTTNDTYLSSDPSDSSDDEPTIKRRRRDQKIKKINLVTVEELQKRNSLDASCLKNTNVRVILPNIIVKQLISNMKVNGGQESRAGNEEKQTEKSLKKEILLDLLTKELNAHLTDNLAVNIHNSVKQTISNSVLREETLQKDDGYVKIIHFKPFSYNNTETDQSNAVLHHETVGTPKTGLTIAENKFPGDVLKHFYSFINNESKTDASTSQIASRDSGDAIKLLGEIKKYPSVDKTNENKRTNVSVAIMIKTVEQPPNPVRKENFGVDKVQSKNISIEIIENDDDKSPGEIVTQKEMVPTGTSVACDSDVIVLDSDDDIEVIESD